MSRGRAPAKGKPRRGLMVGLFSGLMTLIAVALIGLAGGLFAYYFPGPATDNGQVRTVILRQGAGLSEIAGQLQGAGAVRSAALFIAAAQATGAATNLKAGEYEFPSKAPMQAVLRKIREGEVVRRFVTIPEGWTSDMVVEALMKEEALTGAAPTPPEGAILPETYEFLRGEDRAALLGKMMTARDALLAALWERRKPGLPINTPEEAVILASIVEKETGVAAERPRVAAVFVNRLRIGMPLASDPTIIYGVTRGRPLGRGIRQSELDADTPYNTYRRPGLTPTPISNPGREALAAVLDPPDTDELYFVADGTGGHAFAKTYEEHLRNVARWRQIEAGRGQ